MEFLLYPQLGTQSRRCMKRLVTRSGKMYQYSPRGDLLERLARDNGMSLESVRAQLLQERQAIIRQGGIG